MEKTIGQLIQDGNRTALLALLNMRRNKEYRMGALQMAIFCGVIDNPQFHAVAKQIKAGERAIVPPWAKD